MRTKDKQNLVLTAMFLAVGMLLPILTAQIKEIGDSLLPMHLAVMLCGAICGWRSGTLVGAILPFLRSVIFAMPPIYPNAIWMALELATYGSVIGITYSRKKTSSKVYIFFCLICSMIAGRIVWGVAKAILLGVGGTSFGFEAFFVGGFLDAIPGIILQMIVVPLIINIVELKNVKG